VPASLTARSRPRPSSAEYGPELLAPWAIAPYAPESHAPSFNRRRAALPSCLPGSYIIILKEKGPDGKPIKARAVAQRLAKRYGGKITFIYEGLPGFAIKGLSEEKAEALRKEPAVMLVDQDRPMQLVAPIETLEPRK
jgi:hypothetical protein